MSTQSSTILQRVWPHCNVLRDDGISYGDYVEQFTYYGAYNVGPGAGGQDPVGPAVRQMRQRSRSIKEFLDRMSWLASYADLQKAIGK